MFTRPTFAKLRIRLQNRNPILAPTPPVAKSGEVSQDQVTLKSAGQPDHDRR